MPKKSLDKEKLRSELLAYLNQHGLCSAKHLCQTFDISQATLSRMLAVLKDHVLVTGKAQNIKYASCRQIEGVQTPISLYEINEDGSSRQFGLLHAVKPQGSYFEGIAEHTQSAFF